MRGRKPVGSGGCQRALVTQSSCNRKWSTLRVTSKGAKVMLCSRCDEMFGKTVGTLEGFNTLKVSLDSSQKL
jgi:hypothetical protein